MIRCWSNFEWEQIKLRFEIHFQDGTKVGTMFSDTCLSFEKGETKNIRLKMNTAHLTPGRYSVDIVAYIYNEFGMEQFLDGVYPGYIFEIDDRIDERNQLIWLHQYWGHVHLQDVIIDNEK